MDDWRDICESASHAVKGAADTLVRPFTIILALLVVPVALVFLAPMVLQAFAPPLDPNVDLYAASRPGAVTFLDAKGGVLGHRGVAVGERLTLDQMPAYLPAAFIAMEDRRFYSHKAVDLLGLSRAAYLDLRAGHYVAGGSGITQQTAKIVFDRRKRTLSRKLTELVNAASLEDSLSKRQILELYLNRIYLGDGAYGVDGAAHTYFGVSARQVTLAQAAMLAALTRAPSVFSPRRDLAAAQVRARLVLAAMVETGAITPAQAAGANAQPAMITPRKNRDDHSYVLDAAADQTQKLMDERDIPGGDLVVHTTLEPELQEAAEAAAVNAVQKYGAKLRLSQAAIVLMKPDGALSAMVGGVDYQSSVFNRATQAHRQPGSAFKPFVYLAALEAGISPWDYRDDQAVDIGGYQPANYGGESYGRLRLSDALARSVNTIAVKLAQEVGVGNVVAAARRAGITSPLQTNASLALGTNEVTPLELTAAYGLFANGGKPVTPYLVARIDAAAGGAVLYQHEADATQPVIADTTRRDMTAMLTNVVISGTGSQARLSGRDAAGKTGTTQDSRDAWFVGFTTDYVAGVWVGNDNNSPMRGVTGGAVPALIWKDVMMAAEQGHPVRALDRSEAPPPPDDVLDGNARQAYVDEEPSSDFAPSSQNGEVVAGSGLSYRSARNAMPADAGQADQQPVAYAPAPPPPEQDQQRMAYYPPPPPPPQESQRAVYAPAPPQGYSWVERAQPAADDDDRALRPYP